ncbi:MAG TPA: glycoside hydrolase family 2 protein [Candidatus Angelobacter sp.]
MHRLSGCVLVPFLMLSVLCAGQAAVPAAGVPEKIVLAENWLLQSSCKVKATGEQISSASFRPAGWHKTRVPSTVLAALIADKTYADPYFGMNLRSIPGTTYPIAKNFAHLPTPDDSPFKCSWWYRTAFVLPADFHGKSTRLHFEGINYRANVWMNGKLITDSSQVAGAYRTFDLNVTEAAKPGHENVLAVETFIAEPENLAINWVDWNPMPPDKDMGIWKPVYLVASGPVALKNGVVFSKVDPSLESATLTLSVLAENNTSHPVKGMLKASLAGLRLQQEVELAAQEKKTVTFSSDNFPQLKLAHPQLWWPYQMGKPNLHSAHLQFESERAVSDVLSFRFGIREITSELADKGVRLFKINGKSLLVRGGGWAPDMLLRQSRQRLRDEFAYVKHLYLNTVRLEGKIETDDFFDLADEQGILVMAGWCCCDIWEEWDKWQPENHHVATESLRSQALRLRSHPSVLVWLYGSDNPPPPEVEREYLDILKETEWPNPAISSASGTATTVTGASGVKMTGPYQYIPPSYWLNQTATGAKYGGAFGFNTETSPGPAVPPLDSLEKMLPKDHFWPMDDVWNYHAGSQEFKNLDIYSKAMDATYGKPSDLHDYLRKSQAMAYDGERAMFEAYRRNKYSSTGVIQWMLNNAWPSTIWHLYDYFLEPAGGYFGARKANETVHVQFSYDDRSVVLVNAQQRPLSGLKVTAELYGFDLHSLFSKDVTVEAAADGSARLFTIPDAPETGISFVRLKVQNAQGRTVSSNFYWLPAKYSTFDWAATTFEYTPSPTYEDLTQMASLPQVKLSMTAADISTDKGQAIQVRLRNPGKNLAFQVCLRVFNKKNGHDILPVLWDDNYFSLMPGESRTVIATYTANQLQSAEPVVELGGWNIVPVVGHVIRH